MGEVLAWVGGLALVAYALLRLAARVANRRLSVDETGTGRPGGTMGDTLPSGRWVLAPDQQHAVYTLTVEDAEEADPGAPPEPGTGDQAS